MASIGMNEYELEDEFEDMYESEDEFEDESEAESEAFFGGLLSLAKKAMSNPTLRKAALSGAKAALGSFGDFGQTIGGFLPQGEFEDEFEDEFEYEDEDEFGGLISGLLGESEDEFEMEDEFEFEDEEEDEINPYKRIYSEAMMEHFGHAAMEAESEDEAEAFAKAMVPLVKHIAPRSAPTLRVAAPHLARSVAKVAKKILSSPHTRPLMRVLPSIVRSTAHHIARQSHGSRVPISPHKAVRILAHHTAKTLGSPRRAVAAYRRSKALDRHAHAHGMPVRYHHGRVHYRHPSVHARGIGRPAVGGLHPVRGYGYRGVPGYRATSGRAIPTIGGVTSGIPRVRGVYSRKPTLAGRKPRLLRHRRAGRGGGGCGCCNCCGCGGRI